MMNEESLQELQEDLRLLINNPMYSDIEILCKDRKKLYGCRAVLAARSKVFKGMLYYGMKENYEKKISFPTINSSVMEIVLEYVYTGSIKEISLTMDNIVESFHAADYFQLPDLQKFIKETIRDNYAPELLSKVVDTKSLSKNGDLLNCLV